MIIKLLIHRGYIRNSNIKVAIYDDIVEIVSPGGLPNGLTIEDVYSETVESRGNKGKTDI